jgi:hypothetical protein
VARAVVIRGWPAASVHVDELSFGIVQEHFWGLPWWDRKIALVGVPLRDGEIYFIDGTRMYGLLTQFLPVVELEPCSRSTQLKYATVDLRILRDGPPRNGVRIIGQVVYFKADNQHGSVGIEVAISGPAGTATVTTDQNGIYDLTGLPPGHYAITANAKTMRVGQNRCETYPDWDLKSGDVWGCSLSID